MEGSIRESVPKSHTVGYVDPLVASPGGQVLVKVSCSRSVYTSKLLRLGPGLDHPDAPPVKHTIVQAVPETEHRGRLQFTKPGSYARIPIWNAASLEEADSCAVSFWCLPTRIKSDHAQWLFSAQKADKSTGFGCYIDLSGQLCISLSDSLGEIAIETTIYFRQRKWYRLQVSLDLVNLTAIVHANMKDDCISSPAAKDERLFNLRQKPKLAIQGPFCIAGNNNSIIPSKSPVKSSSFNGKIDSFKVESVSNGLSTTVLDFDFVAGMNTDRILDSSANQSHGQLVNAPARAVTGHDWDGSVVDWTKAKFGYGAIHFHDDDVDDAGWETDFILNVPIDLRSGCYGVLVDDGVTRDIISLFVRPDLAKEGPKTALIIPTFTYTGKFVT